MLAKGILKQDPEANIWAQEGLEMGVEKSPQKGNHNLYCSHNILRVIKSRRLRWTGLVPRMEEGRNDFEILTGKPIEQ